jgi:hypothetical protein
MRKTSQKVAAAALSITLIMGPGLAATADDHTGPPQHVLDKAIEGLGHGQARAAEMKALAATRDHETGMPDHAQGDPGHATGLERAQEMVEAAAQKLKGYEKPFPGNGNAFGRGHAELVHNALAQEISPSTLAPRGDKAQNMVKAIEKFTDEKPGRGLGRNNKGEDGDE